jgi:SAM-dependent methyltransferase
MSAVVHGNLWRNNLAKPAGLMGQLVSEYLASENYELNMWAVHALQIQKGDKVLEIGFGPGIAAEEMAKITPAEYIAGIDYSELMVAKAKKRNADAIAQGKMDLRHANVTELPDFGTTFDKVIAINNVMYWPETIESLQKVRQFLSPNGLIALVIQRNADMYCKGQCAQEVGWYGHCLQQAGFSDVGVFAQPVALERQFGQTTLAGIAIYGYNPVTCLVSPENYLKIHTESLLDGMLKRPSTAGSLGLLQVS